MNLTLVLEYSSLKLLLFLLYPANRHEARILREGMDELRRKRLARQRDTVIVDKSFYALQELFNGNKLIQDCSLDVPKE
ncbi:hypothetical protein [Geoglobus ahangari]